MVSIPGQGTKILHAMWHNQKKKQNTWVQVKGISSLTLLSGHLDFYGPSAAIGCVGFMPPIFTIHSAIVPIERVRSVLITALIS